VDQFDEFESLFRTLGMSEAEAKVGATGRYRSEAAAREAFVDGEAEDLADQLAAQAERRPSAYQQELAQVGAAIPVVAENVMRQLRGQAPLPVPGQQRVALAPAAESVVGQVSESLKMTPTDARTFAGRLYDREVRRAGVSHAERFLSSFGESLRSGRAVCEVAPR
jgi:hypothetical protein